LHASLSNESPPQPADGARDRGAIKRSLLYALVAPVLLGAVVGIVRV
jgi:hypothetical protein